MEIAEVFIACKKEAHYSKELLLPQPVLLHVFSGEVKIATAARTYCFGAGETVLLPRNQLGRMSKLPVAEVPCQVISVLFRQERLLHYYAHHPLAQRVPPSTQPRTLPEHPLVKSLFNSLLPYFDLAATLPADIAALKVEEAIRVLRTVTPAVDELLAQFDEPGKVQLAAFMEQHYMFNLPLVKFGYLTGRSLTTFKKDFQEAFFTSPGKWLTRKRLALAHYQLVEQKKRPSEVYLEVGFEDLSHFSFAFKKQFGYSPNQAGLG